ncbi:MAG: DUF2071 domain-containing protein [Ignavibacteria bacterium]|nr:DUF2071 domain-containing protein [Ignavibacteria bacterium]
MNEPTVFLTARWQDLILITYDVDPKILLPLCPAGLEPDTINGRGFISLVAFDFMDTKVKGIKFPFHVNFPEINLRFYVKDNERRGVVFIKEFVPKQIIPLIANTFYNENYKAITMTSDVDKNGQIKIHHKIKINGKFYEIKAEADNDPVIPEDNLVENFFKEQEWGFGKTKDGQTLIYRVQHPVWKIYPNAKVEHNFEFNLIYGKEWSLLNDKKPYNVTIARGSNVKLFSAKTVE